MKKLISGIGFLVSGILMYTASSIIAGMNVENTTEWSNSLGRYWQTVANLGLIPMIVFGCVFIIMGVIFMLWGTFAKSDK